MTDAWTSERMSPELVKVAERARREPQAQFHSLAHLIDVAALKRAFHRQRKDATPGVDGVTKEVYGQNLEDNLQDLHDRLRSRRYRHQPILRVHIPKEGRGDKTRPIGISCFEDKLVQEALREVLEAVYEQDFRDSSYGFRPGRSAHDALRVLHRVAFKGELNWIIEADLASYFDSIDRSRLLEMLQRRIPDGSIRRLVGKCLHVGVLDGEELSRPERGTAQGSVLSPLLGNLYLHHVLDVWFEDQIKPRLRGQAEVVRFADDFVIGFEREDDARRVMEVLGRRMEKYGLTLQPEKTRLLSFQRPSVDQKGGKGPNTFDFLGFTLYWRQTRKGHWMLTCKTRRTRLRRAIQTVYDWCRRHRHLPIPVQHAGLVRRIRGHINYFGVSGNARSLVPLVYHAEQAWYKWLRRRGQRTRLNWERFTDLLRDYPLPRPRVAVSLWGTNS
jgi:group II intron reverse transcriptase/maturase